MKQEENAEQKKCTNCKWYYGWFGVCFNGNSEMVAGCPDEFGVEVCEYWEKK